MLSRLMAWVLLAGMGVSWSVFAHAEGDAHAGEKKFYTCYGCHGLPNYRNAYPDYSVPMLRHQHAAYVSSALHEYKIGARPHATMHAQAVSLSDEDMADIAAYLQGEGIKPAAADTGKAPPQVASCAACHGPNGSGVAADLQPKPPILAGQHEDYLVRALDEYKKGGRKNPVMKGFAANLKDEDIAVIAHYFSHLRPSLSTESRPYTILTAH